MQQDRKPKTFSFTHSFTNIYCIVSCASLCTRNTTVRKSQCLALGKMSELGLGVDKGQGWGECKAEGPASMACLSSSAI